MFFRKLPETHKYLNNIDPAAFKVYDYKIHQVMGDNSIYNVYPLWTGHRLLKQKMS
jgi:hypothetical protein